MLPEVTAAEQNLPGPPLVCSVKIQVIEQSLVNRDSAGSSVRSSAGALRVLNALHLQSLGYAAIYAGNAPVAPVDVKKGFFSHMVTLTLQFRGLSGPGKPAEVEVEMGEQGWTARETERNWYAVASSADAVKLVACVQGGQIYTSIDSGVTWTARETAREWSWVASSADGVKLVACVQGGQIHTSTDSGVTWTARETEKSWISVASSADGAKLVACVYGGQIYTSSNSGVTWTVRESTRDWYAVASSADGAKLVACVYDGQIYTSSNSGVTWTARESTRDWVSLASSADGTMLVACVYGGQIYTSSNSGGTWTARESARNWGGVACSSDGTRIIAGVQGGQIYNSIDSGVTWTNLLALDKGWYSITASNDGLKIVASAFGGQIRIYDPAPALTFTCTTAGATIRYTTDGSYPTPAKGTLYSAPFPPPPVGTTVRAAAYKTGLNPGDVLEFDIRES
jgi:hypothetical protein